MPLNTTPVINEQKTQILRFSFFDSSVPPVATAPSRVNMSIYDVISGHAVRAAADLGSLASVMDVEITSAENSIIDQDNEFETRIVTVMWYFGVGGKGTEEYVYRVKNLRYVP